MGRPERSFAPVICPRRCAVTGAAGNCRKTSASRKNVLMEALPERVPRTFYGTLSHEGAGRERTIPPITEMGNRRSRKCTIPALETSGVPTLVEQHQLVCAITIRMKIGG